MIKFCLVDDCDLADRSFAAVFCGCLHHIDAARHALALQVASVPVVRTASASALVDESAAGCDNLHVGVIAQSDDGYVACVVGRNGVGVGIYVVLGHLLVRGGGIALIRAQTFVGGKIYCA